jgi:hypothetical protein
MKSKLQNYLEANKIGVGELAKKLEMTDAQVLTICISGIFSVRLAFKYATALGCLTKDIQEDAMPVECSKSLADKTTKALDDLFEQFGGVVSVSMACYSLGIQEAGLRARMKSVSKYKIKMRRIILSESV